MKSLVEFILESKEASTSTVSFNFDGIDNVEELIKSFNDMENVTVDGNTVSVTVSDSNYENLSDVVDKLSETIKGERDSEKSTNDEQYAQKVQKLEKSLSKLNDVISEFDNDDDDNDNDNKNGEE